MLIIFKPKDKVPFATPAIAGFSGLYSGINSESLSIGNMISYNAKAKGNKDAIPSGFMYRMLLEECSTVHEASELLKKHKHYSANNLMMIDKTDTCRLAEIDGERVFFRKPQGSFLYATNHFESKEMAAKRVNCSRYKVFTNEILYKDDAVTFKQSKELLKKTTIEHLNIQSMIFRPATLELYLSQGTLPAVKGEYKHLKLEKLLERTKPEEKK
jgi:predicted choloylglycine hydrolase